MRLLAFAISLGSLPCVHALAVALPQDSEVLSAPLPDLAAGTLDERAVALRQWANSGADVLDLLDKGKDVVRLLLDLSDAGRYADVERSGVTYADLVSGYLQAQRALYIAASAAIDRGRWSQAGAILDRLEAEQQAPSGGTLGPYEARERAYYHLGRAELARVRGRLDQAAAALENARGELADVAELGPGTLFSLEIEIEASELATLLGDGAYVQASARAGRILAEIDGRDTYEAWQRRRILRRKAAALHMLSLDDAAVRAEARAVLTALVEDPGSPRGMRFEARSRRAQLRLLDGDVDAAGADAAWLERTANSALEEAIAASQLASCALARGDEALESFDARWSATFEALLAQWIEDPVSPGGTGFLQFSEQRILLVTGLELAARRFPKDPMRALQRYLAVERVGSLARRLKSQAVDPSNLLDSVVEEGEVVLIPVQSVLGSRLFCISQAEILHVEIEPFTATRGPAHELQRMLRGVGLSGLAPAQMADRLEEFAHLGDRLGTAIIPPAVRERLGRAQFVTLVEGGVAGPLPIQVVRVDGEPMGERWAIARTPSLAVESALAARNMTNDGALVLAANVAAEGLHVDAAAAGLDRIELDAEAIERLVAPFGSVGRVVQKTDACEERFQRGDVSAGARVLEIVAHGHLDPERSRPPSLVLGSDRRGDGLWRCDEVERAPLPAVVVLAACRTTGAVERNGDSYAADLGGAFLTGGARVVVLAPGDLPLDATLRLLEGLNRSLARGSTVAEALRDARNEVAAVDGYSDPYFHSQMEVLGDGGMRPYPGGLAGRSGVGLLARIAGAAVALAALAFALSRRSAARSQAE